MKKALFLFSILFSLLCIFSTSEKMAFAQETCNISYYAEGSMILSQNVPTGTVLTSLMTYATVRGMEKDLEEGTRYAWKVGSEEGEEAVEPYAVNADTSFYYVPIETNVTCTIEYRFDYVSDENYQKESISYLYGEVWTMPREILDKETKGGVYEDGRYLNPIYIGYVLGDYVAYVRLIEDAVIYIDGEEYTVPYGEKVNLSDKILSEKITGYYVDENKTSAFDGVAVNGLQLYTTREKTKYVVKLVLPDKSETTLYYDIKFPFIKEKDIAEYAKYWYLGEENGAILAEIPYVLTEDVTLYGEWTERQIEQEEEEPTVAPTQEETKEEKIRLSTKEIIALAVTVLIFVGAGVGVFLRSRYQKKKKYGTTNVKKNERKPQKEGKKEKSIFDKNKR